MEHVDKIVAIIEEASEFVFDDLGLPALGLYPEAQWFKDQLVLRSEFASDRSSSGIYLITAHYLSEASLEMKAMAVLIRARVVHYSLAQLVRAIVERAGVVGWILDDPGSWQLRMRRADLAWAVSNFKYTNLYRTSDPDAVEHLKTERAEIKSELEHLFPISDEVGFVTSYNGDPPGWMVCGDSYPSFRNLSVEAFKSPNTESTLAKYVYDYLAVHSHPTIHAGMELVEQISTEDSEYKMTDADVNRLVRIALTALLNGIRRWDGYFRDNPPQRVFFRESLFDRFDALGLGD